MFERVLAILGAIWLTGKMEESREKRESCGCGCLCVTGLWLLGVLLLKSCGGLTPFRQSSSSFPAAASSIFILKLKASGSPALIAFCR